MPKTSLMVSTIGAGVKIINKIIALMQQIGHGFY